MYGTIFSAYGGAVPSIPDPDGGQQVGEKQYSEGVYFIVCVSDSQRSAASSASRKWLLSKWLQFIFKKSSRANVRLLGAEEDPGIWSKFRLFGAERASSGRGYPIRYRLFSFMVSLFGCKNPKNVETIFLA